jgi:hypothetical protein
LQLLFCGEGTGTFIAKSTKVSSPSVLETPSIFFFSACFECFRKWEMAREEGAFGGYDHWPFIFACVHEGYQGMVIHERHVWPWHARHESDQSFLSLRSL